MQVRFIVLTLAATAVLAACGSAKDASKGNFEKAINIYLGKNCQSLSIVPRSILDMGGPGPKFPIQVPVAESKSDAEIAQNLDTLKKAGLLASTVKSVAPVSIFGRGKPVDGKEYTLTQAGSKALAAGTNSSFCVGVRRVDEIVKFTAPANREGAMVSTATYTYTLGDIPSWAKDKNVQAAYPIIASRLLKSKGTSRADLVLMNDGWEADQPMF